MDLHGDSKVERLVLKVYHAQSTNVTRENFLKLLTSFTTRFVSKQILIEDILLNRNEQQYLKFWYNNQYGEYLYEDKKLFVRQFDSKNEETKN